MLKIEYQNLVKNKPWQETEKYFNKLPKAEVKPITNLNIDTEQRQHKRYPERNAWQWKHKKTRSRSYHDTDEVNC